MTTKFNDQLHEDLFDLLILELMGMNVSRMSSEASFKLHWKSEDYFRMFRDLFELELAQESYEVYVSDTDIDSLKKPDLYDNPILYWQDEKHGEFEHRINITIGAE